MPRPPTQSPLFSSVADVSKRLSTAGYLPDAQIATTVFLADRLGQPALGEGTAGSLPHPQMPPPVSRADRRGKPLLVEGPAGTAKTELAKALASATGAELI